MIKTRQILYILLITVLLLFHGAPGSSAKDVIGAIKEEKGVSLDSIDGIFPLVMSEYAEKVTQNTLVNGGITGIKEYLKKQKINDASIREIPKNLPDNVQIEQFNKVYNKLLSSNLQINKEKLSYAAIRGIMKSLNDPYSVFLDPKEYASLMEQMKGGSFGGIGIYIELDKQNGNQLTIVESIEGTPGYNAGLKSGDVIIKVDGKSTKGVTINESQKLLRGEVGSRTTLTIQRAGVKKPFDVEIIRDMIRVKTLIFKMLDNNVGYIKLRIFGENTSQEMKDALEDLEARGARGYILDLRNNGGGYVNAALAVCSNFLATGSKVVTIIKKGSPQIPYTSSPNLHIKVPMVNLVNKYSASASEITAGALQDYKAGTIMGSKTFGKASVQKIFPLPNSSAVKITTAHYVTPKGRDINKRGIMPDITVEEKKDKDKKVQVKPGPPEKEADLQLESAQKLLDEQIRKWENDRSAQRTIADAIPVRSLDEQYEYIRKNFGNDAEIVRNLLFYQKGQIFDKVTIRKDKTEKNLIFDIQEIY
ncbi:MAG: S41 family peptidase [Candidatus Xenobiia bacterium LiM19]